MEWAKWAAAAAAAWSILAGTSAIGLFSGLEVPWIYAPVDLIDLTLGWRPRKGPTAAISTMLLALAIGSLIPPKRTLEGDIDQIRREKESYLERGHCKLNCRTFKGG